MTKNNRKADLAQVRKSLAVLRKKGLYNPANARKKPTKYAISLIKKFSDVVRGRADVVKADKETIKKLKEDYRTKSGRVVIERPSFSSGVRINRKTREIEHTIRQGNRVYVTRPANVSSVEDLPELGRGETYVVPFMAGRKLRYEFTDDLEEIEALVNTYEQRQSSDGKRHDYANIMRYLLIAKRTR